MLNALPFYWAGYRLEVRYTYRLDGLGSTDALWDGLRDNVRREIRKARKRVEVVDDLGVDRFYDVLSKTYARQRIPTPHSLAELERLEAACARRGAGAMLFARDEAGRIHAVAWVVWDRSRRLLPAGGRGPAPAHERRQQPAGVGGDHARARRSPTSSTSTARCSSRSSASSAPSAAGRRRT